MFNGEAYRVTSRLTRVGFAIGEGVAISDASPNKTPWVSESREYGQAATVTDEAEDPTCDCRRVCGPGVWWWRRRTVDGTRRRGLRYVYRVPHQVLLVLPADGQPSAERREEPVRVPALLSVGAGQRALQVGHRARTAGESSRPCVHTQHQRLVTRSVLFYWECLLHTGRYEQQAGSDRSSGSRYY